jgi:hypothetical protein
MTREGGGKPVSEPRSCEDVACPACPARAGEPCRTPGHNLAKQPHGPRVELFAQTQREIRKLNEWNQSCQPRR